MAVCCLQTNVSMFTKCHTPRGREFRECVRCRETLWSFLSQLITPQDHTIRCDSAQCGSASGAGILIDVKTTKCSKRWWVLCIERVRKIGMCTTLLKQGNPNILLLKCCCSVNGAQCVLNRKMLSSWDCYIFVSCKGFNAFSWHLVTFVITLPVTMPVLIDTKYSEETFIMPRMANIFLDPKMSKLLWYITL